MAEEWNVEEFGKYRDFILRLRQRLRTDRVSFGVPQLIPQPQGTPTEFLDIILRTTNGRVTFRLRRDNLYLIGYQMQDDEGTWLEFGRDGDDPHLIPGSTFLGFGGSYYEMARAAGRARPEGLQVAAATLVTAVDDLATSVDYATRARRLIVVIMMICEATRLNPILTTVATGLSTIQVWMMNAVRNWGSFCRVLGLRDADPTDTWLPQTDLVLPPPLNPAEVEATSNFLRVVGILGIMLYKCNRPPQRMLLVDDDQCFLGGPLVEVFSVRIDNIDNEDPGQLYGTILLNNGFTQQIYNRPRRYFESIRPGQNVTLTGPLQSTWAEGGFTIQLLLTDSDSWSPDDEVVNDRISFDALDFRSASRYDKPISQQVKGKYGSATVNYAVLRNASTALVTINLQEGGEDMVEVYGSVVANYSHWDDPNTTSVLFKRPRDDYLQVRQWQNMPLLKSIMAVPLGSSLKITASLYDYDPITPDDKIAVGTVEFPAAVSGESSKDIVGEDGNRVTVMVRWGDATAPQGDRGYSLSVHDEL